MNTTKKVHKVIAALSLFLSIITPVNAHTHTGLVERAVESPRAHQTALSVPPAAKQSWAIAFDNDVLVPGRRDQDYTYGFNINFAGDKSLSHWLSLHTPISWLDDALGLKGQKAHKIEYGLFGFTPEDISASQTGKNDRPYASLVYTSSTTEHYNMAQEVAWSSTLSLGVLGTNIVGDLQKEVHKLTDGDKPSGWGSQISDGGELTARYTLARQALITESTSGAELKSTLQASVGYITEASWSLSGRAGKIHTPWVTFNPELTSYGEKATPGSNAKLYEHYFWAGLSLKARAYNVFLQGQFKESEVEFNDDEVRHLLIEAWAGYTVALSSGYRFTYSLRGHSSELKEGDGDRGVLWGGIQLAKTFS